MVNAVPISFPPCYLTRRPPSAPQEISYARVDEIISEIDEDRSGKVDFDEFLKVMAVVKNEGTLGGGSGSGSGLQQFAG